MYSDIIHALRRGIPNDILEEHFEDESGNWNKHNVVQSIRQWHEAALFNEVNSILDQIIAIPDKERVGFLEVHCNEIREKYA